MSDNQTFTEQQQLVTAAINAQTAQLSRAYALIEEMREAMDVLIDPYVAEDFPHGMDGDSAATDGYRRAYRTARNSIAKADAFLKERGQ